MSELLDFVLFNVNAEWDELLKEFVQLSPETFRSQPDPNLHSIGWHVRHVLDWRYALVHVMICGQPCEEKLWCLGWENDPVINRLAASPGRWIEPQFTIAQDLEYADRVRGITNAEIAALTPARYSQEMTFPWATNRVIDEILQEAVRHSAIHRGQIRELKKSYSRRYSREAK